MASYYGKTNMVDDEDDVPECTLEELRGMEKVIGFPGSQHVYFSINDELVDYFKKTGKGYLNRMNILVNSLLKDYVNSHMEGVMQ